MDKRVSLRDRLYMPPVKKYARYGLYPWKIAIHLLIVIFTSIQVIMVINRAAMYSLGHNILWNVLFLDMDANGGTEVLTINSYNLFSEAEIRKYVQRTVDVYYDVNGETFGEYSFQWTQGEKQPVKLWAEYLDESFMQEEGLLHEYPLTRLDLGPLDKSQSRRFLNSVRMFQLEFSLEHHIPHKVPLASTCYTWKVIQIYNFAARGAVNVSLKLDRSLCKTLSGNPVHLFHHYQWVSLVVAALALLSFAIVWKSLMQRAVILAKLQGQSVDDTTSAWERLGLGDKLKFFNFWVVVCLLGNLLQLFGAIVALEDEDNTLELHETLVGFGCFFAWVNSVGYLPHSSASYTIINTMKRAAPMLSRYIIGVLPIFMAYAFLGIGLFWSSGYYPNVMYSMMMLFANVNGDSLYLILSATSNQYFFFGQVYYFTFLVFFIW